LALFAKPEEVGWYAGLWHDLGKYIEKWQKYLRGNGAKVYHSHQGAMLAFELCEDLDIIPAITFVIAAHHTGLKDPRHLASREFEQYGSNWQIALKTAKTEIAEILPKSLPDINLPTLRREFAIRMLFSALIDSDHTDAMNFEQKYQNPQSVEILVAPRLQFTFQSSFFIRCNCKFSPQLLPSASTKIERLRNVFAQYCIAAAASPKGLFRLTGACGIGKTKSSLQFALIHAQKHQLSRIIYVAPLKSIIEQNAAVYRKILGSNSVLEHHSGFEPQLEEARKYKLDTERWDKPVIVTSGVQFYESLFSNLPAKCRKLHNIANSVILIDEAQSVPLNLAIPILDVLETLVSDWGCTVVLMSATQPAFDRLNLGNNAIDIVPQEQVNRQFQQLERVTYRSYIEKSWTWDDLACDIKSSQQQQSLTVVNTTKLARAGYQELAAIVPGTWFHLSTRMCPEHRDRILQQVRARLKDNLPCHLISTQLIEAGVNVDFPRVYRQLAPLDSIIQTAGRCNRNGKLNKLDAIATIFKLDGASDPLREYTNRIEITRAILTKDAEALDSNLPKSIRQYFLQIYNQIHAEEGNKIQQLRFAYNYPEVAKKFKVINDEAQSPVVVPWREGKNLVAELQSKEVLSSQDWRRLQRYTVLLPVDYTAVEELANGLRIWQGNYDSNFGVSLDS